MTTTLQRPAHPQPPPHPPRLLSLPAGWPLTGLLLFYPLWWLLGLGTLIFPIAAVPMAVILLRQHLAGRPVRIPPGFGMWLVFLAVVVLGLAALGTTPAGTVSESAADRLLGAGYRIAGYASLTVLLLYAGNLGEHELPRRRLVRLLAWLFVITVAGGLVGTFAGHAAITSPVELLLPGQLRGNGFVQSLVRPYAAQVMDVGGGEVPRPAAPWGYTNTWGNNFLLLVGWFIAAVWGFWGRQRGERSEPSDQAAPVMGPGRQRGERSEPSGQAAPSGGLGRQRAERSEPSGQAAAARGLGRRGRLAGIAGLGVLAVALVPAVYSLNRGLWIGLAVIGIWVAVRLALRGRVAALVTIAVGAAVLAAAVAASPLGATIGQRLEQGRSDGIRAYLAQRALAGVAESPVIGFGSTRSTQGGRHSIAVGPTPDCAQCGAFTVGGNGQLWQLLFAHGLLGTLAYVGFFGYGLWRLRGNRGPIGLASEAAIVGSFVSMLWYNALVTPLAFAMLSYALRWRDSNPQAVS